MDHTKEDGFELGVAQFRRALLSAVDEFYQQRFTTIEEARGADCVAEIVRDLTRCEYCCKWLTPVGGKLPDHLSQTGHQCPNMGQQADNQTRSHWP